MSAKCHKRIFSIRFTGGWIAVSNVKITEDKDVHVGAQIAGYCFFGARHDWLLPIKAGVENYWDSGELGECLDDIIEAPVRGAVDSLDSRRSIDMDRGRN